MDIKDTVSKIKIVCSQGAETIKDIPSSVITVQEFQDWLNSLGIGSFDVTDNSPNDITIKQFESSCLVYYFVNNEFINCNV